MYSPWYRSLPTGGRGLPASEEEEPCSMGDPEPRDGLGLRRWLPAESSRGFKYMAGALADGCGDKVAMYPWKLVLAGIGTSGLFM